MVTGFDKPPNALERRMRSPIRKVKKSQCTLIQSVCSRSTFALGRRKIERLGSWQCEVSKSEPLVCFSVTREFSWFCMKCEIAPPHQVGRESEAEQISTQKLRTCLTSHLAMPKINPQHDLTVGLLPTKPHQRMLPTHTRGTSNPVADVKVDNRCFKVTRRSKFSGQHWWAREQSGAEKMRNFSAMKSGYTMRLFMHDINNDDVFTRIEDVEAWVLLVKHRNMAVTGQPTFLKFVDGPQRCEERCACSVSTIGCSLDGLFFFFFLKRLSAAALHSE